MKPSLLCPGPAALREFLLGQLSRAWVESLAHHLEQCRGCAERLRELSDSLSDPLLETLRDLPPGPLPAASRRVQELMARLEQLHGPADMALLSPPRGAGGPYSLS